MTNQLEVQANQASIEQSVDTNEVTDVTTLITELDNAKKNQNYDNIYTGPTYEELVRYAFENIGAHVLGHIETNAKNVMNSITTSDDAKIGVFTKALDAFEEDMKQYSTKKEKENKEEQTEDSDKNLLYELEMVANIRKIITDKQTEIKTKEENETIASNLLSLNYATKEMTNTFFETSKESDFNATMEEIYKEQGGTDTPIEVTTDKEKGKKLLEMIKVYMDAEEIRKVRIGKSSDDFCSSYVDGTRSIEYERGIQLEDNKETSIDDVKYTRDKKTKTLKTEADPNPNALDYVDATNGIIYLKTKEEIVRGTEKDLQFKRAQKKAQDDEFEKERTPTTGINIFDGQGSFETFRMFLEKKDEVFVKENMEKIIADMKGYVVSSTIEGKLDKQIPNPDKGKDIDIQNGYANVLTEYVTTHYTEDLMNTYISHLTIANLNMLGVDKTTRNDNYNKLIKSWNSTGLWKDLPPDTQKRLIDMQATILETEKPKTAVEALNQGLDKLIDTFGPMLFNILKFFGIGKATLLKRFHGMETKINDIYKKEYGLSQEEIDGVIGLSKEFSSDELKSGGNNLILETGEQIEEAFADSKTTYITKLTEKEEYYTYINIDILKTGLETYNKDKKTGLNINDIIKTEKDTTTNKEKIVKIENASIFKEILINIVDNDDTWTNIASANKEIKTPSEKDATKNEHNMEIGEDKDAGRYKIKSLRDVARYLTASLYTTKDLAYTLTENGLHNQTTLTNKPAESTETDDEVLAFDAKYVNADGKVINQSKMIHEVIKMDNLPTNIKITKANGTVIEATLVTLADGTKTYVEKSKAKNQKLTIDDRVQIVLNDVISLPESKNISQVRNDIKTILEKQESKDAQKEYEKKEYTSNKQNIYQQNIQTFGDLFEPTQHPYYDQLIAEKDNTTLKEIIEKNMVHIKNMFLNGGSIDGNLTKRDGNVIDIEKQKFELKEAKDGNIIITVTKKDAADKNTKNGTIIFDKKEKEKHIQRKEEVPTTTAASNTTTAASNTTTAASNTTTAASNTTTAASNLKGAY